MQFIGIMALFAPHTQRSSPMSDTAPEKIFTNLPKTVPFSLNQNKRLPHGLCWFAGKDGTLPDAEAVWRDSFAASEEEIIFSNDKKRLRKVLSKHEPFALPCRCIVETDGDGGKESDPCLGVGLGKKADSDNLLYALRLEPNGLLAAGRTREGELSHFIEDVSLFFCAMPDFPLHPSRIASAKDDSGMGNSGPSEEKNLLGPWNFAALRSTSLKNLKSRLAAALTAISAPDKLWAAYLRIDELLLDTAVFSLTEADGKKLLNEPLMLFGATSGVEFGTRKADTLLKMLLFWQ
jgi:hypothetical protein